MTNFRYNYTHQPRLSPVEECARIFLRVSRPKERCLKECATLQALPLGRGKNERAHSFSAVKYFFHLYSLVSVSKPMCSRTELELLCIYTRQVMGPGSSFASQ